MSDQPAPNLADVLTKLATDVGDLQGKMMYGDRWADVKARAAAEAAERAEAERKRDRLWHVVLAYFLCCAAAMGLPLVVLVWRAAW